LLGFVRRFRIAQKVANQLFDSRGRLGRQQGQGTLSRIDWKKTRVVGSPQGPLYINRRLAKSHDDYENLRTGLINKLESLKDPGTGKNVITKVYKREEAYHGYYTRQAPDLIALDADEYHNRGGIGRSAILEPSEWRGNNARNGLFLFSGHGIQQNKRLEDITIFDLAPTILHLMNIPIPDDMDGRVLEEIFQNHSEPARRPVRYQAPAEESRIRGKISELKNSKKV
jgi:predicted AlkP superfamily phosphohydrolase/phosphomutase